MLSLASIGLRRPRSVMQVVVAGIEGEEFLVDATGRR